VITDFGLKTPGMSEVIRIERFLNSSKLAGSCRLMTYEKQHTALLSVEAQTGRGGISKGISY